MLANRFVFLRSALLDFFRNLGTRHWLLRSYNVSNGFSSGFTLIPFRHFALLVNLFQIGLLQFYSLMSRLVRVAKRVSGNKFPGYKSAKSTSVGSMQRQQQSLFNSCNLFFTWQAQMVCPKDMGRNRARSLFLRQCADASLLGRVGVSGSIDVRDWINSERRSRPRRIYSAGFVAQPPPDLPLA